jgi:hypothetical protein
MGKRQLHGDENTLNPIRQLGADARSRKTLCPFLEFIAKIIRIFVFLDEARLMRSKVKPLVFNGKQLFCSGEREWHSTCKCPNQSLHVFFIPLA